MQAQEGLSYSFYLEGVHCANCLRKLDTIQSKIPGLSSYDFDMSRKTLRVDGYNLDQNLIQSEISSLGFTAHGLVGDMDQIQQQKREDRNLLMRMGLAGFCSGNIMLLAISVYAGAIGAEARFMNWLSFFLSLPVVVYSAWPLYLASWKGLLNRQISVDLPIALAILGGYVLSLLSLFGAPINSEQIVYFDSISLLIFLLLIGRYLLRKVQQKYLRESRIKEFLKLDWAWSQDGKTQIKIDQIKPGDLILVKTGETLPADGILKSNIGILQLALLTGESEPKELRLQDPVYLGTQNLGPDILLQVTAGILDSRLQKILEKMDSAIKEKSRYVQILDRIGQIFLLTVLITAALVLIYFWPTDPQVAIYRALSFILVTCPCTIAFSVPLAFSLGLKRAAANGILLKSPQVFEKINGVEKIFFDKTGTLTDGVYDLLSFKILDQSLFFKHLEVITQGVAQSVHPVSKALFRYMQKHYSGLQTQTNSSLKIREIPTLGLEIVSENLCLLISSSRIEINGKKIAEFVMGDRIHHEANSISYWFQRKNIPMFILSGDTQEKAMQIAQLLGVQEKQVLGGLTPEAKENIITKEESAMMVGDGANDSLALARASVGVAVFGSLPSSLRSADVYLLLPGLLPIKTLFELSENVIRVVVRNLSIGVVYNIIAGTLAILGMISPLWAAVLMPLSSLSQLASSLGVLRFKKVGSTI